MLRGLWLKSLKGTMLATMLSMLVGASSCIRIERGRKEALGEREREEEEEEEEKAKKHSTRQPMILMITIFEAWEC